MAVDLKKKKAKGSLFFCFLLPLSGDIFGNSSNPGAVKAPGCMVSNQCSSISSSNGDSGAQFSWAQALATGRAAGAAGDGELALSISMSVGPDFLPKG